MVKAVEDITGYVKAFLRYDSIVHAGYNSGLVSCNACEGFVCVEYWVEGQDIIRSMTIKKESIPAHYRFFDDDMSGEFFGKELLECLFNEGVIDAKELLYISIER